MKYCVLLMCVATSLHSADHDSKVPYEQLFAAQAPQKTPDAAPQPINPGAPIDPLNSDSGRDDALAMSVSDSQACKIICYFCCCWRYKNRAHK